MRYSTAAKVFFLSFFFTVMVLFSLQPAHVAAEKIGVLYVVHGGFDEYHPQHLWDASIHLFSFRPDHTVHKLCIWKEYWWKSILTAGNAPKEIKKYAFNYNRLGGTDPFHSITDQQLVDIELALGSTSCPDTQFVLDYASWMAGDAIEHYPYPRFLYYPPAYINSATNLTYCGEQEKSYVAIDFESGSVAFSAGETLTGSSGATALIDELSVTAGSWTTGDAQGRLYISDLVANTAGEYFTIDEILTGSGGGQAFAASRNRWPDCDPERYNVDGPAERFITEGVDRIIIVDMTTGGVRFFKTYDVVQMIKLALSENGGESIPVTWVNDPTDLMENSYPTGPVGIAGMWTPDLGEPTVDPSVPLAENPNPVTADAELALLHVEGIEENFNPAVPDAQVGVLLLNHATRDWSQFYDPKIDDTLVINQNIKAQLLSRHPDIDPANIIGAYMGIKEDGTAEGFSGTERTRNMRGENLGHAWLYEQPNGTMPSGEWGYRYWDALEYLKDRGVEHIVVGFPQIVTNSVLNLVEIHNQIGKEIGIKNWLYWGTPDFSTYPGTGHPFADYWGIWVDTECGIEDCCFEMGGCTDGRPYPPPRQKSGARDDLDPSLAYDLSDYGHLGYDETGASGDPDPNAPVQDQYTGTWAMWSPPNADERLAELMAAYVLQYAGCPTLITLQSFVAEPGSRKVTLQWKTASEIDTAGYNIYRAETQDGEYVRANSDLIPAKGTPDAGALYTFTDTGVKNRNTYYYRLEDVENDGDTGMHGPVSATPRLIFALGQ